MGTEYNSVERNTHARLINPGLRDYGPGKAQPHFEKATRPDTTRRGETYEVHQPPRHSPGSSLSGGPGWLSKYIAAGILTALVLAVSLASHLQSPPTAHAHDYGNVVCSSTRGESCSLIFLSSTKRTAKSTDTALCNSFGQDLAAADHADIHNRPLREG